MTDQPSLLARIDRAIYRLQNTHGLPLQPLGVRSDPDAVLRNCGADPMYMRRVLSELRETVLEQVGKDQTDRGAGARVPCDASIATSLRARAGARGHAVDYTSCDEC